SLVPRHVLVQRHEHRVRPAVRTGRPAGPFVEERADAFPQLRHLRLRQPQAEPGHPGVVEVDQAHLGEERLQQGRAAAGDPGLADVEAPGLAGGEVRHLAGSPGASAFRLRGQEPGRHQLADVVQGRGRVRVELLGDLLVRKRPVEAQPQDPQPYRRSQRPGLHLGRRPPAWLRRTRHAIRLTKLVDFSQSVGDAPAVRFLPRPGLLREHDFRQLFVADTISQLGSQVSLLALPLVAVLALQASNFEVGALATCDTLAFLLIGLPAGAWVDRMRRRSVLIAGDLGRAVVLGSGPVAWWFDALTMPQLYVVGL